MTAESTETDVIELVADVLEVPTTAVTNTRPLTEFEQWDSLHQLNLMLALEEHFGIELAPDDLERLSSVETIVALVTQCRG